LKVDVYQRVVLEKNRLAASGPTPLKTPHRKRMPTTASIHAAVWMASTHIRMGMIM
jgi:hypothetical protein